MQTVALTGEKRTDPVNERVRILEIEMMVCMLVKWRKYVKVIFSP
jgi:hypothetical protein